MSDLPHPDSRAYRALVLSGRLAALQDMLGVVDQLGNRLADADDDDTLPIMIANWRELMAWLEEAGAEVRTDLELLKQEAPT